MLLSSLRRLLSSGSFLKMMGIGVFGTMILFSCNESLPVDETTLGYDFYPVAVGQYRIYDVEEIQYRITGFDTTNYQLRETVFDSIVSLDQTTYLVRRDIRANELAEWESDSIWSITPTDLYLAVTENSIPFIKLTFPVREGIEWDGNSLNARGNQTYYYQQVSESAFEGIEAADLIRVIIEDIPENTTGIDLRSEVFARNVGLVEKDYLTQVKCTSGSCGDDFGEVEGGRSLKQRLLEFGVLNE